MANANVNAKANVKANAKAKATKSISRVRLDKTQATALTDAKTPVDANTSTEAKTPADAKTPAEKVIGQSIFFQGLDDELLAKLAQLARWKSFKAKETIFSAQDKVIGFYLVASGLVRIYLTEPKGRERTVHLCGEGIVFGEAAVFLHDGYPASAEAVADSKVLLFSVKEFKELLTKNPDVSLAIIGILAQRLNHFRAIVESSLKELLPRLAESLLSLKDDDGKVKLPTTKTQMAARLGTTAESLSRALRRLKSAGLIAESKPYLVIVDRSGLNDVAEGLRTV
ncbi:MAG: cyclic nucleotide-binding domain-containing protein [Deltaproteobacteria bacterium]|jgi:CRP/FNR family transcriptional regulator|nr:cyclic nucleotide-binding domain-containing protein [Deltaproteobacteria bacterium]